MKKTGAWLARTALERIGVRFTFGIPGVHNTELYDELAQSASITPVLVTHEGGGAFAADAVSRVSDGLALGTLAIVPAAGLTHAASGIGEAMLAGVPMLVITGGARGDTGRRYQLHEIDQLAIARALTKGAWRVQHQAEVMPTIFAAARLALSGEPGPVLVELPVEVLLFTGEVPDELPAWDPPVPPMFTDDNGLREAVECLASARRPGVFVGWGARHARGAIERIAQALGAPVATTLQGLASFPHPHPLHAGFGFGESAVPAARHAFAGCDALLAVGTRFSEIATGSYGVQVPAQLVHVDINPAVFDANYPAAVRLAGDAEAVCNRLAAALEDRLAANPAGAARGADTARRIAADKAAYRASWLAHDSRGRVNPQRFFDELRLQSPDEAIATVDDGNHTYLTAELFPVPAGGRLIVPTDFNAMGYAVPAAIGAKLAQPDREVFAIVGDGAFAMTCMELITATTHGLGIVCYVFHDGMLSQIAQAQQAPYRRQPCTTLGRIELRGVADAVGAGYQRIDGDQELAGGIAAARALAANGRPVIVDLAIDYGRRTCFTAGTLRTNLRRLPAGQKLRIVARALRRRITG